MNVLFVSQCQKRALTETRRILDQFAERRGQKTWQTPITAQGLDTVRRVLKKSARRNTAVACHWIRRKNHSELVWIVGNATRFNEDGAVPTNTTKRDVLRENAEDDWRTAQDIRLLAEMAALFHDFGKANSAFIKKLASSKPVADAYRHEWVSLRMFEAFVAGREDQQWLGDLASGTTTDEWLAQVRRDDSPGRIVSPFAKGSLAPLAATIGWLIVSHHRLPVSREGTVGARGLVLLPRTIDSSWNGARVDSTAGDKALCWEFPHGSPLASNHWRIRAQKLATRMLERPGLPKGDWLKNTYVAHLSRLSLMLADHYYSSQPASPSLGDAKFPIFANTDRKTRAPKQRLDEHLIGVANHSAKIARTLPRLRELLPRIARHKGFVRRTKNARFRWQDHAFDLASSLARRSDEQGFFGVNMASTGCGKTLANGRIMYGLADPKLGARFSIALGLRTLTLQTGQAYRERLGLGDDDLAIMVGGAAVRALFELNTPRLSTFETSGSESSEEFLGQSAHVHFEGALPVGPLSGWLKNSPDASKLLAAPILVSTIDHLMPATEGTRGGRQIAPMLRLLTSDLVLDEPDDFGIEDLPALSRLVNWAGLLGSRVLLSSATLPPAMVQGLFEAYMAGRASYQQNRGTPGKGVAPWCGWFDEFRCTSSEHSTSDGFLVAHRAFAQRRSEKLGTRVQQRLAKIQAVDVGRQGKGEQRARLAQQFLASAQELHAEHHSVDPHSGKKVSFGLIRMANIDPLFDVAEAFLALSASSTTCVHLCCYHSRHPLVVRSRIESELDRLLNRSEPERIFECEAGLRNVLDRGDETNHIFVVLASPVAEVGRDHDYDWAVIEPSSMRSIIQLAGRIRRHRGGECTSANLVLLETNLKHLEGQRIAYQKPGFEAEHFALESHMLGELLSDEQLKQIDSRPRLLERELLVPRGNLVDLEHQRLAAKMLGGQKGVGAVNRWWTTQASLSAQLQREEPFRFDPIGSDFFVLTLDDEGCAPVLNQIDDMGELVESANLMQESELELGMGMSTWGTVGYAEALEELAGRLSMGLGPCMRKFGTVSLPRGNEQGWIYSQHLGFRRTR